MACFRQTQMNTGEKSLGRVLQLVPVSPSTLLPARGALQLWTPAVGSPLQKSSPAAPLPRDVVVEHWPNIEQEATAFILLFYFLLVMYLTDLYG